MQITNLIYAILILTSSIICSIISTYFFKPDNVNTRIDKENSNCRYVLRPRLKIWIRQLCYSILLLIRVVQPFNLFDYRFDLENVLICISITLSILLDGINNISITKAKILWLAVYSMTFPYFLNFYLSSISSISISSISISTSSCTELLLWSIGSVATVLEVLLSQAIPQIRPVTMEFTCNLIDYLFYSHLNEILIKPMQHKVMEFEDVPNIIDSDTSFYCWNQMNSNVKKHPSLTWRLFLLVRYDWIAQGFFQLASDTCAFLSPVALQIILSYVSDESRNVIQRSQIINIDIDVYTAAIILFINPLIRSICDGQNYTRAKRIGMRVRSALITIIYEKSLNVDLSAYKEGPGKINNLISVDVNSIQEFSNYSHFLWSTLYSISLCLVFLYLILGYAAIWGLGVMILIMLIGLIASKQLEYFQGELLRNKDKRMSIINEVLNGIRIIKLFAWEDNFLLKLSKARSTEVKTLKYWIYTNMVQKVIWEVAPVAVACTAFIIYVYIYGHTLSPPIGYASLTLFNALRYPLGVFPDIIAGVVSANISIERINVYLNTEDTHGLKNQFHKPKSDKNIIEVKSLSLGWRETLQPSTEKSEKSFLYQIFGNVIGIIATTLSRLQYILFTIPSLLSRSKSRSKFQSKSSLSKSKVAYININTNDEDEDEKNGIEMSTSLNESEHISINLISELSEKNIHIHETTNPILYDQGDAIDPFDRFDQKSGEQQHSHSHINNNLTKVLSKVYFSLPKGSLIVIAGPTGCGKSTLLAGLLGECQIIKGKVYIAPNSIISYVPQQSWIQNATFKENILFGNDMKDERYSKVLKACSLDSDIKLLEFGDETEIGEKGVNLSGGQQQRVSLGRASYSESDLIILDDPLSAVDAHVGQHIFDHLICGFLSDRTRILVTHQVAIAAPKADIVICLDSHGNIIANCPPSQLKSAILSNPTYISRQTSLESDVSYTESIDSTIGSDQRGTLKSSKSLTFLDNIITAVDISLSRPKTPDVDNVDNDDSNGNGNDIYSYETSKGHNTNVTNSTNDKMMISPMSISQAAKQIENTEFNGSSTTSMNHSIRFLSPPNLSNIQSNNHGIATSTSDTSTVAEKTNRKGKIIEVEGKRAGEVPLAIYWFYLKACGGYLATFLLIGFSIALTAAWTLQNWGLGVWMKALQSGNPRQGLKTLPIYLICVSCVVFGTLVRYLLEATFSCRGAQSLHDKLTATVIQAPCSWFDATPIGRIVNRFSQDISTVDKDIMGNLTAFFDSLCGMFQVAVIVSITLPILLLPMIPILIFTSYVAKQFFQVAREIKRLESVSKSPVFVLFSETLQGLSIIRAYQQQRRFFDVCFQRIDNMNRCYLYLWLSNRWLNIRMQTMGSIVSGLVAFSIVYNVNSLNSTMAGLLLLYSIEFTGYLVWIARYHAEVQMNLNSVERIQEYASIQPEKYHIQGNSNLSHFNTLSSTNQSLSHTLGNTSVKPSYSGVPENWPQQGRIEFKNLYLKYASTTEYVLRNVSFVAPAGKKIGIVGRTGAGKSSLLASLFRTVEPTSGELIIDDINVLSLPLHTLRSRLAIVPQEPILFEGSIRSNLDPFNNSTDAMIWQALAQVKLSDHIVSMPGNNLEDKLVSEKGSNFSVGQKQLLCMARALLRNTSILVLDECTANVDHETDALIQDTVRNELKNITVLCIAHRLHTIAYYDFIVVMDKGSVAEYGSPVELIEKETSIFRSMCNSTGDFETICKIAKGSIASYTMGNLEIGLDATGNTFPTRSYSISNSSDSMNNSDFYDITSITRAVSV